MIFFLFLGVGTALAYTPGYIIVGEYFEKRKALAMSLATFASGVGAMFPPAMLYLFELYGYSGALLIIGGISLHCCIGGMFFRPLRDKFIGKKTLHVEMKEIKSSISNGSSVSNGSLNRIEDKEKRVSRILQASLESLHSFHPRKEDALSLTKEEEETEKEKLRPTKGNEELSHSVKMLLILVMMRMKFSMIPAKRMEVLIHHHKGTWKTERRASFTNQTQNKKYLIWLF